MLLFKKKELRVRVLNNRILCLINNGYTVNEMISELNLSCRQLNKMLRESKQIGIDFNKKY